MSSMLHTDAGHGLLEIVIRTSAVYLCLLLGLRLSGKREIGQITPFDLAVLLLISNAVQNAMTGGDNSLTGGLVSAGALLALNALVARIRMRSPRLQRFVEGVPTVLVSRGSAGRGGALRAGREAAALESGSFVSLRTTVKGRARR